MSDERLVRKVLRSLPQRFAYKVAAIEEAKDITKMSLEELMGSLITFEMNHIGDQGADKRARGIALKASVQQGVQESVQPDETELNENMMLLMKNFNKWRKNNGKTSLKFKKKDQTAENSQKDESAQKEIPRRGIQIFINIYTKKSSWI